MKTAATFVVPFSINVFREILPIEVLFINPMRLDDVLSSLLFSVIINERFLYLNVFRSIWSEVDLGSSMQIIKTVAAICACILLLRRGNMI